MCFESCERMPGSSGLHDYDFQVYTNLIVVFGGQELETTIYNTYFTDFENFL